MVCGVFQQIKNILHSSFLYENSDFPTFYPETFSSCVCHQGAYRFGSPVLTRNNRSLYGSLYGHSTLDLSTSPRPRLDPRPSTRSRLYSRSSTLDQVETIFSTFGQVGNLHIDLRPTRHTSPRRVTLISVTFIPKVSKCTSTDLCDIYYR